jgi:hypothetical protein
MAPSIRLGRCTGWAPVATPRIGHSPAWNPGAAICHIPPRLCIIGQIVQRPKHRIPWAGELSPEMAVDGTRSGGHVNVSLEREGPAGLRRAAVGARLARPFFGITGLVAVACGAVASGWGVWDGPSVARLFLAWLLTDLAWGTVWDLLNGLDGTPGRKEAAPGRVPGLPYTQPGSASYRLLQMLHALRRDWGWRSAAVLLAIGISIGLTALLPAALRPLTAAALALCLAGAIVRRHEGRPSAGGQALLTLGLPWLAGHVAYAPLTMPALVAAAGCTLALWGYLRVLNPDRRRDRSLEPASKGVLQVILGQVILGALVAWLRQPWLTTGVLALLLPALALWPVLAQEMSPHQREADRHWYVRWAGMGLVAALPLAALALAG